MADTDVDRFVPEELHSRPGAIVGGLALAAGVAMGIAMGIKMRSGATRLERRVDDYRGAWNQIRGH